MPEFGFTLTKKELVSFLQREAVGEFAPPPEHLIKDPLLGCEHLIRNAYIETLVSCYAKRSGYKLLLDVGCWSGILTQKYAQYIPSIGFDLSLDKLLIMPVLQRDMLVQADWDLIPFKTGTFDIVVLDQCLEHAINPDILLKECKRVCKDVFICSVPKAPEYEKDIPFFGHLRGYDLTSFIENVNKFFKVTFATELNGPIGYTWLMAVCDAMM